MSTHQVKNPEYSMLIFIIPKKEGNMIFTTYNQILNQKLLIKTYTLPIIGETMHKLEVFQYATSLDLNMGYYMVDIFPKVKT